MSSESSKAPGARTRTYAEELAGFAVSTGWEGIPEEVRAKVRAHVLDSFGVALASAGEPFGRSLLRSVRELGTGGSCGVIGSGVRLPAAWAALVNGTLVHGLDFDDTHQEAVLHVSSGVLPAALASAEETGADGRAFVRALALGMETAIRVALVAPGAFHDRGFHPTGICNVFGAVVAGGLLHGLSAEKLAAALGLAGSQAGGLLEFLSDGSDVKRLHGGWAAHSGLVAVRLAGSGFSGPREVFEGRFGFYRAYLGGEAYRAERLVEGLGERWHVLETALKPYPCCHYLHAFLDAALGLRRAEGFHAGRIVRVECSVPEREIPVICEPEPGKKKPRTPYDAKFSLPYTLACMLVRGHVDLDDFREEAIRERSVLEVASRVAYRPAGDMGFPRRFGGRIRVELADGRILEAEEATNRGSPERPLSAREVEEKFFRNAGRTLPPAASEKLARAIAELDTLPRAGELALLSQKDGTAS
ncbi:MAG: MmgE/Prp family protein [Candidatus Binatia bacterium]|nr:MAG: MmgE/Prp family protein [Candidatus Binatia bacterium]